MTTKLKKVILTISRRALMARINRKLAHELQMLKTTRERWRGDVGDYYLVDLTRNLIVDTHVKPEELGRKLGVLKEWEGVEKSC